LTNIPLSSLKVFLSHTNEFNKYPDSSNDKTYVARAKDAVEKFNHKCIEMEAFTADPSSPEDYDARLVKECDVYIGIIGMRYGSLTSEGISHTEHEYNTALKENKKIFVFILDDNSVDSKLPVEVLHSGVMYKNQDAFKNKVKSNHIVKFFKNTEDLYNHVCDALLVLKNTPLDCSWLSPWDFGPYRAERCKVFYGREWLFTKVRDWAQNPNAERALLLTAAYGVGKTAFLAKLVTDQCSGLPLAAEHFCQGGVNDTLSPGRFVSSVAAQLVRTLPSYRLLLQAPEASHLRKLLVDATQKPVEAWDQAVVAPLYQIPEPETNHLLVVDALDVAISHRPTAGEPKGVTIVGLLTLHTSPPHWLRVLATSRNEENVKYRIQERFKHDVETLEDKDPKNIDDLFNYVVERCKSEKLSQKLSAAKLTSREVAHYLSSFKNSAGKFLYVESMLKALEADQIPLDNIYDLQALPTGMDLFYSLTFERGFPAMDTYEYTRNILGIMCEAMEPLGLIELAAIIGGDLKQIRTCLHPLQTLLIYKDSPKEKKTVVSFEHVSLTQWLSELDAKNSKPKENPFEVDRKQAKDMIHQWALDEVEKGTAHIRSYLARHLSSHLNDKERPEIISKLLTSFDWIQARLEHTNINTLLDDFQIAGINDAGQKPVLKMLQRALGQSEQILRNQPIQMPSQLLARLAPMSDKEANNNALINVIHTLRSVRPVHNKLAVPLTPSLFKPQLARSISIPIPQLGSSAKPVSKITSLCISSDRSFVYLGLADGSLWSWDLSKGEYNSTNIYSEAIENKKRHDAEVSSIVELKHTHDLIASASRDKKIIIWNRYSLQPVKELIGHADAINCLLAIRYNKASFLISASDDQTLRVWGAEGGELLKEIEYAKAGQTNDTQIFHLSAFTDNEFFSVSTDGVINKWDIYSKESEFIYGIPTSLEPYQLSFLSSNRILKYIISIHRCDSKLHVVTHFADANQTRSYIVDMSKSTGEEVNSWASVNINSFFSINNDHFYYSLKDSPIIYSKLINSTQDEDLEVELGYNESPIDCLALSRDIQGKHQLASASIKKNTAGDQFIQISLWDTDMQSISLQRSHRTPVVWITSLHDDKKIFSFGTDGSLYIWEPKNIRLYETSPDLNLSYLNPLSSLNLNDFHDDEAIASFRFFKLDKSMFVIRKTGGLFLYEILYNSSATSYSVESKPFHIYNKIRSSYEPVSIIKSKYLGYVFGCIDGRIIHVPNYNKTSFNFYTRQACKNGSVEFLYEININQLLCWPSIPSNDEVFSICNFQLGKGSIVDGDQGESNYKETVNSFKIKSDDFEKLGSGRAAFTLIRPLLIWNHERNIAISHSNYIVSIWKWDDRNAELELLHYLEGHTSIVNDLIQLDNGNYVTISDDKTIRNWEYRREVQMLNGNILFTSDYELKTFTKCELYEITILAIGDEQGNIHWMKIS
jgi:WD40 repeat protein